MPSVVLKPRKAQPFFCRHPWVLDSAVSHIEGEAVDGGEVDLLSDKGQWIARGIYNSQSRIRTRLYSWQPGAALDAEFWRTKLKAAILLRRDMGFDDPRGAARLVFSEADGLSGLIVDRFASQLVVQPTSLAFTQRLPLITELLEEIVKPEGICIRTEEGTLRREKAEIAAGHLRGNPPEDGFCIEEHGIRYGVHLLTGQKTGFYLDQRENRLAAARWMRGRRLLDMCCYTGGFSLAAAKIGGAAETLGIDASEPAVLMARENATRNEVSNATFEQGECFETLERYAAEKRAFDAIVLDPPKFVRGRAGVPEALRAYHRINQLAVELLNPDGVLVTCSCSGNVTREDFQDMLFGVAVRTKREIRILERRGASSDHPTNLFCPETEYLKCFICRVA